MNVETQQMDPRIARIHFIDYKKRVKEHRLEREARLKAMKEYAMPLIEQRSVRRERTILEREDEQLMAAYKAMALGQKVLNLNTVMLKAGALDRSKQFLPKLAIAKASWYECYFTCAGRVARYCSNRWDAHTKERVDIPVQAFPAEVTNCAWRSDQQFAEYPARAIVPSIPSFLRPSGDLGEFCILWEADWQMAPVDPLLLKHVHGPIYTVLAQWDLTSLERSILEGRLS
jgi:hypothetical protein